MRLDRAGTRLAAGTVAAVAGYSSWRHIVEVASGAGEDGSVAAVMPLSIDGLIVVSTLAMLEDKRNGCRPRLSARIGLALGVAGTLAFNLASAAPAWDARGVAAVPAVAFLVAVEILSRTGKPRQTVAVPVPDVVPAEPVPPVVTSSPKVKPPKPRRQDAAPAEPDTRTRVRKAAEKMPDAGPEELAVALGVSERTVRRYLPAQPEPAVRPVISLVPAAPAEPELIPDPAHGGDRVPVGAAT